MNKPRGAQPKRSWPEGATAGLVVLGAACFGIAMLIYGLAGPRDAFAP